jgi:NifU-like protein
MEHFLHPQNVGEIEDADGVGEVGNASCGDALKLTFKLDAKGRIAEVKFKTFGCVSAIASSSALTELIKGMTLEEAAKVTNQDIVKLLGELPEEKMHCSVMGMEALQAAIANYKGEKNPFEADEDHEGRIVCRCFGVTDVKIKKVARENKLRKAEDITHYCKAGGACGACLGDIQQLLDDLWNNANVQEEAFEQLPIVKRVTRVQEIIDKEIKPLLEQDGGSIDLVDIQGSRITVRLKGRCAHCPSSGVTLKNVVEDKLREFVSSALTVEVAD